MLRWILWQGTKDWARLQLPLCAAGGILGAWLGAWLLERGFDPWWAVEMAGFVVGMSLLGWLGGTGLFLVSYWWRERQRQRQRDTEV